MASSVIASKRDLAFGIGDALVERHRGDGAHGVFAAPDRGRRLVDDAADQPVDLGVEFGCRHHVVQKPGGLRRPGVEGFAGQRPLVDQAARRDRLQQRHHLHREHADLHLGQSENHVVGRDRHVGHAQQAHAAGHADAADPRDRRLGGVLRQPQQIGVIDIRPGKIHREGGAAVLQIGAGAKRLVARPGQDDDADVLVVMRFAIAPGDAGDHVAVEGVALVRPVDGDPERRPALFTDHAVIVGHCPARLFRHARRTLAAGWRRTASAI